VVEVAPDTMLAWRVTAPGPVIASPLTLVRSPAPACAVDELFVRVRACGVCRTDLHVAEGDLPVHRRNVVPGHEIVGVVEGLGPDVTGWAVGDRVGVAWLRRTCGDCRFCRRGDENLCPTSMYTGWDADGGYAEYATVPAAYAYHLPDGPPDEAIAPLLCAGIIGFRALRRAGVRTGMRLGIYGFGASAHLTAQLAVAAYGARVHVVTRSLAAQRLALELGAASAGGSAEAVPEPLDAAIFFAPAGDLVPPALRTLDRGGVLVIAGIHLSDIPSLRYESELFYEREIRSVTANTRVDGRDFLELVGRHRPTVRTQPYPFRAADRALTDLAADRVTGAAVLVFDPAR
jgi:alcohol dehydrogenase, propanol-preferring